MKLKLIFATLFLMIIGNINGQHTFHVDAELKPSLQRALLELKKRGVNYDPMSESFVVMFGRTRNRAAGVSHGKNKDGVLIFINEDVFRGYDIRTRVWVMIHELAHDVYNLEHKDTGVMTVEVPNIINKKLWEESLTNLIEDIKHGEHEH